MIGLETRGSAVQRAPRLDPSILAQFTGSEHWYRHGLFRSVAYTDGVQYVAEQAGAYWLVDIIAIAQRLDDKVLQETFQHWKIEVRDNASAVVTCDDGNGNELYRQEIAWTDFPEKSFAFYCAEDGVLGNGITRVMLLPSDY